MEITLTCREGKCPSGPVNLPPLISRQSSEDQVKTRWDETYLLQPTGTIPAWCTGRGQVRNDPFLFLSSVPPGRPISVFLIKAGKTEQGHLRLIFLPLELSSISILFSTHYLLLQFLLFLICHCCSETKLYQKLSIFLGEWVPAIQPALLSKAFIFCTPRLFPSLWRIAEFSPFSLAAHISNPGAKQDQWSPCRGYGKIFGAD